MNGFLHYWEVVRKKLLLILLVSVAAAVIALVIVKRMEASHEVYFSYLVSLSQRDQASEFRFDGYYALQATDLFAATLARWLSTPEVVVAAYREAGVDLPSEDPRSLVRVVKAEKAAPQLVTVTVREKTQAGAEALARGLREVMARNIVAYHAEGIPALEFAAVPTEPWSGVIKPSVPVVVTAAFVFTFLIVLNSVLLVETLKQRN